MTSYGKPLLGPSFEEQGAQSFFSHVSALRRIPSHRVKPSRPKALALKGKFLAKGTLSEPGEYEMRFGEMAFKFRFVLERDGTRGRKRPVSAESLQMICDAFPKAKPQVIAKFLRAKKFALDSSIAL